ncbi:hypothetical protein ES705_40369 [subsurface metagenome]
MSALLEKGLEVVDQFDHLLDSLPGPFILDKVLLSDHLVAIFRKEAFVRLRS